jgi:hypothetical protein
MNRNFDAGLSIAFSNAFEIVAWRGIWFFSLARVLNPGDLGGVETKVESNSVVSVRSEDGKR